MAEHVDHVELIFGIDAELNGGSNGEDLSKNCGQFVDKLKWPHLTLKFYSTNVTHGGFQIFG
jgi:hypothetical protein